MFTNIEELQKASKTHLESTTAAAAALSRGLQEISAELADYSKKSLEESATHVESLLGAKTIDTAVQLQSEYARSAYEGFVARSTKIGELYTRLVRDAFKPAELASNLAQGKSAYSSK